MDYLFVALGGALGASARYSLANVTLLVGLEFPVGTLLVNVLGSLVIGIIAGVATRSKVFSHNATLFLKVGICGGFTTFSSFSLEVFELYTQQKYVTASLYVAASVVGCIIGVMLGDWVSRSLLGK